MASKFVKMSDFRKLEKKVQKIYEIYEEDLALTPGEKKLVEEAKRDIKNNDRSKLIPLEKVLSRFKKS